MVSQLAEAARTGCMCFYAQTKAYLHVLVSNPRLLSSTFPLRTVNSKGVTTHVVHVTSFSPGSGEKLGQVTLRQTRAGLQLA